MGWDIERFPEGEVNLELICCICTCILEDPVESPCRHVFCSACIKTWLSNQKSCPHCRAPVHKKDLKSVVPLLKNIISKQKIYCDNKEEGCPEIVTLERLSSHAAVCQFKVVPCLNEGCIVKVCRKDLKSHIEICSKRTVLCEQGCEMFLTLGERTTHNCVQALRCHFQEVTNEMQDRISKLEELVNVLVTKIPNRTGDAPSSRGNSDENFGLVPYSIPSPRSYENTTTPYTVFNGVRRLNSSANVTSANNAENNDFSDSVESVQSENVEQDNDVETPHSTTTTSRDNEYISQTTTSRTHPNISTSERMTSPIYRMIREVRETERGTVRPRSSHRRQFEPYARRSNGNRSRENRSERETRSYPYYETRESRRVNTNDEGGVQDEPLVLRIGVSSQTVTDSSTSSASSSDSDNEE